MSKVGTALICAVGYFDLTETCACQLERPENVNRVRGKSHARLRNEPLTSR